MKLIIATGLLLGTLATGAIAQDSSGRSPATNPEQRTRHCEVEAKLMPEAKRETFMQECMKRNTPAVENQRQQQMKECSRRAGDRKGDEYKAFMKECQGT
ncbi:PsiF family protein [Paracidovorax citrulli]